MSVHTVPPRRPLRLRVPQQPVDPEAGSSNGSGSGDHELSAMRNGDAGKVAGAPIVQVEPQHQRVDNNNRLEVRRDLVVDEPKELRRDLGERHINMIAFSTIVGVGLFLQSGRVIYLAGPGMAFIAYILMGTALWSVMASLGEMTALFPVPGALFEFPCRFVDESIGYAVGWMSWFAWVVVIAAEVDAVAQLFTFEFPLGYLHRPAVNGFDYPEKTLQWSTRTTNPAIWVTLFLFFIFIVNMLRVRIYGEIEYWIGCFKMLFIVGLIMFNVVINAQTGTAFKYYQTPWGFISHAFKTSTGNTYYGASAHLAGVWTAMTVTIFSMMGIESVAISAAEARDPDSRRHEDAIKLATRKISLRIILLYSLATFVVGLNVPYDDPNLVDAAINSLGSGRHSAFIIAAVRNNIIFWPRFINGFFILSATSAGINSLYLSSRLLHALALTKHVWPEWAEFLRSRLERTYGGVPRASVFASWLFGLLGYLAAGTAPSQALGRLAINSTASMLIVYAVICVSYLRFYKCLKRAVQADYDQPGVDRRQDVRAYNRRATSTYPYMSHGQYLRAWYGFVACSLMGLLNGWRSISPFSAGDFIASYISVIVFLVISLLYHIKLQGFNPLGWSFDANEDLRGPVMATRSRDYPRGTFHLPNEDRLWAIENAVAAGQWIWVWMK